MICRELKRENILYKPEIYTDANPDGSRSFKLTVLVYPDKNNLDEFSKIPYDCFIDQTYFTIKDLYDDLESKGFDDENLDRANDDEIFGWSLAEQWIEIGNVYFFLLSMFNLIDVADESNIYDSKGVKVGTLSYGMSLKLFDTDKKTQLNAIDYDNLDELHEKWL